MPPHVKIEAGKLWIRGLRGAWHPVLDQQPQESDEQLFDRWVELEANKVYDRFKNKETDRIAEILSWLIPILLLALGVLVASLIPD
jgi:hypothetical protein